MKLVAGLFLGIILFGFTSASAQMSRGTIENALTDEIFAGCEFISIQDGVDTPMRFALTFPSTPNVKPEIHGTDPLTEFSSDFNNNGFFFSTNATDVFTIRLDVDYDNPSDVPRLFLYELFTNDNTMNQAGNWNLVGNNFCKIIEFNARPAPHILTDEEIVITIAGYQKEQNESIQAKQDETNNMIAIIVIAVTTVSVIGVIVLIMMKYSKSKDTANSIFVTKQFGKQVEKFSDVSKFLLMSINFQDTKIENLAKTVERQLRDIMIAVFNHQEDVKKLSFPKPQPAYIVTPQDKVTSGMNMFDRLKSSITKKKPVQQSVPTPDEQEKISAGMNVFNAVKSVSDKIGLTQPEKKEETLYDTLKKKTSVELNAEYESMYKNISEYHTNPIFKERFDLIMKIIKEGFEV